MQSTAHATDAPDELLGFRLTAADRCDSCGAQAYMRVVLESGGELLFCAHHGNKHREKLAGLAKTWHDESDRLVDESR